MPSTDMSEPASKNRIESVPFVDLGLQTQTIHAEVTEAIEQVLSRCDFILGSEVQRFEEGFAHFVGAKHAVGVASGLDALRLSLLACGIGPGDEVIIPANTYIATALAASSIGARPVLVDCDPATYNIDISRIEDAITPAVRAVIPVHLTGQAADMTPLVEIARKNDLIVIEDACQAHGTKYKGQSCGTLGRCGCFSFYPGKNLGAVGDGGLVTTNDDDVAERLRLLRNYGQKVKYQHLAQGVNSRLDTIQAAVLNVKLRRLPDWNAARARCADEYRKRLSGMDEITFQQRDGDSTHIYHLFIIETDRRDELQAHLASRNIQTGIHYPLPVHLQAAYQELGYSEGSFPVSERLAKRMLSLPMFPELRLEQIQYVAASIREFFQQ